MTNHAPLQQSMLRAAYHRYLLQSGLRIGLRQHNPDALSDESNGLFQSNDPPVLIIPNEHLESSWCDTSGILRRDPENNFTCPLGAAWGDSWVTLPQLNALRITERTHELHSAWQNTLQLEAADAFAPRAVQPHTRAVFWEQWQQMALTEEIDVAIQVLIGKKMPKHVLALGDHGAWLAPITTVTYNETVWSLANRTTIGDVFHLVGDDS